MYMPQLFIHVPVYLDQFGFLSASQRDIVDCVANCRQYSEVSHFEVETYAWNVLPAELQQDSLASGIAKELHWFTNLATEHGLL